MLTWPGARPAPQPLLRRGPGLGFRTQGEAAPPTPALGAWGGGLAFLEGRQGLSLPGTLPAGPPCSPFPQPPGHLQGQACGPGGEWGVGGPRPRVGRWGTGKGPGSSERNSSNNTDSWGRAGARGDKHPVARGPRARSSPEGNAHFTVSLAGPTAGAVMVAASAWHPPWSPAR